jgi:hypothetical protein
MEKDRRDHAVIEEERKMVLEEKNCGDGQGENFREMGL